MRPFRAIAIASFCVAAPSLASAADNDAAVRATVAALLPGAADVDVQPSPVAGLHEVAAGMEVFYVSADGAHVLGGPLIEAGTRTNLSERRLDGQRGRS